MLNSIKLTLENWANQLKSIINLIFVVISGLLAAFLYVEIEKNKANQELIKNDKVKSEVDDLSVKVNADNSSIASEEEKRKLLEQQLQEEKGETVSAQDLANFLADIPNDDK